jgi:hypothetical protein
LVRCSNTDQEAAGKRKPLPYGSNPATCPVRTLAAWLEAAELTEGPILRPVNRHNRSACSLVKPLSSALQRAPRRSGR